MSRQRRALTLCLTITVLAGILVWWLVAGGKSTDSALSPAVQDGAAVPGVRVRDTPRGNAQESAKPEFQREGNRLVAEQEHSQPAPSCTLVLNLQDGSSAPGHSFIYRVESMTEANNTTWADSLDQQGLAGRSDLNGRFRIPARAFERVEVPFAIRVAHTEEGWRWSGNARSGLPADSRWTLILLDERREEYTLTLHRVGGVSFQIVYEDGVLYEGSIGGSAHKVDGSWESFRAEVGPNGEAVVGLAADVERIHFLIHGARAGFAAQTEVSRRANTLKALERVVIPHDPNQALLRVDLSSWTYGEAVEIKVGKWLGLDGGAFESSGGETWETFSLLASEEGIPHYIQVRGESGIWRSELFQMHRGKTVVLRPVPQMPGTILARVVDEHGQPLVPAILTTTTWRYADWFRDGRPSATRRGGRSRNGEKVNADEAGRCELSEVMPGEVIVTVEAWGCEVRRLPVRLEPGETVDLGEVVCHPARGKVVFQLGNRKPGLKYYCWVITPPPDSPYRTIEQEEATDVFEIAGLPLREYKLILMAGNGGDGLVIASVKLTEESPLVEINVDVAKLRTVEEREAGK